MSASHLEPLLQEAERRAIVMVLRSHPDWTLEHLLGLLHDTGARTARLRKLTLGELLAEPASQAIRLAYDGGPPIDLAKVQAATQLRGPEFDEHVREVLAEAKGRAVAASYLRARVGGPRWKLQAALKRLTEAGLVQRSGTTSATRYRVTNTERA